MYLAAWYELNARRARSRGLMRDGDEEPMAVLIASSPATGGWLDEALVGRRLRQPDISPVVSGFRWRRRRRSERHRVAADRQSTTSELQSLMRISYAVFCLK